MIQRIVLNSIFVMRKKAQQLEYISQINRNGKGTSKVSKSKLQYLNMENASYYLRCLSISEKTFIDFNFSAFKGS